MLSAAEGDNLIAHQTQSEWRAVLTQAVMQTETECDVIFSECWSFSGVINRVDIYLGVYYRSNLEACLIDYQFMTK